MDRSSELGAAFRLDGQVAVVVGGTGELGSRMAEALAVAGARTIVVGRDSAKAADVLAPIALAGFDAVFEPCDVNHREELRALVGRVLDSHGRIDVLVNAAGVNSSTPFLDIADEEIEKIIRIDQLAVLRACQEFGRYFVDRATDTGTGASVVNIGSASGLTPLSRVFSYSMAKAAVHNLTKSLAREWGPLGIRCNVLVPGFFPAEQNRTILDPDRLETIISHTPMGRLGEPEELMGALLLLASDAGRFITGIELVVDGGFGCTTI